MHVGAEDKQLEANNICLENSQHEASSLTMKDIPGAGWATVPTFGHLMQNDGDYFSYILALLLYFGMRAVHLYMHSMAILQKKHCNSCQRFPVDTNED